MRVVVVGASGNVGTALLRRIAADTTITSVTGVARRVPARTPPPPYDVADWVACDVGAGDDDAPTVAALARTFAGADAVVHLAWAIQPSHDRATLRSTNVVGTRRVAQAAVRAGVPHLVVASSVGAYSPVADDDPRDEDLPTGGTRTSTYSVDKVSVEQLLDRVEADHPSLVVTRLRPALVFQRDAGHEIARYFLGPFVPTPVLAGKVPVLPWPTGLRLQVVHADDLAEAFREAVVRQVPGAFNVAAPQVLHGHDVAAVVSQGRVRDVPARAARLALSAAWRVRAVPVGPGWFDMALGVPVLSTARAGRSLGWQPARTGHEALAELVEGIAAGAGTASPPMRARWRL
ncbi:NAD-dependent epimerase/dehydratase family protein [Cellulomonas sp. SLBN-39]|uniref:NAD-dependent epimerase/dehydratase family protein n=1 Tax=Cellulomonas sp. SLBN-39 TaxID=2768446 RepID=UPI00115169AE|nr:NAD-dependent epimerase/dehydratase family protein [Cellulomonas sp. SLBN-39]TQL03614.1 nucleoside-diphosphate-sugar epimerase [Cellulomonas sp. SLBN-39]